jgi:hypothetical protein
MDLAQYWGFVRSEASQISSASPEGFAHITSKEDRLRGLVGGKVCEATPTVAAKCIIDNTHRLSTAEEIEAFKAERTKREQELAQKELKNRMKIFEFGHQAPPQIMEPARSARK